MQGLYVAARPTSESLRKLDRIVKKYNIPNPVLIDNIHSTIVFSKLYDDVSVDKKKVFYAKIKYFKVFKTRACRLGLVVELDSQDLIDRHIFYMDKYNLTYEFDSYIPHITLSYDIADSFDVSIINEAMTQLVFRGEYREALDLDWVNLA